jgi:beta-galactosidase/beta-glucuronidase
VDLGGSWVATEVDEAVRRDSIAANVDDSAWPAVPVPGHWRATDAFAGSTGPILHRHRFLAERPLPDTRAWLVFDGIASQGDVWLDGSYLGDTDGWFRRHTFDVTELLADRDEHALAVEVASGRHPLLGTLAAAAPDDDPGGIWAPVRIEQTGPVRIRDLRILCREASDELAVVILRAELDSDQARSISLRTSVAGVERIDEHPLARGSNLVDWTLGIDQPDRWWPAALGRQPRHDLTVECQVEGRTSHALTRRIGFRAVTRRDRILLVNGERLFVKGVAVTSPSARIGEVPAEHWTAVVEDAVAAGLDLARVHGFVAPAALYDAADRVGLLLWQDLPLVGEVDRRARRQAVRAAGALVDLLGHHPSIAFWCGHDEPVGSERLDRAVARAFEQADPTRPVVPRATTPGWIAKGRDPAAVGRLVPRLVRFASNLPPDRHAVEALRRLKYRPAGGFCLAAGLIEGRDDDVLAACRPVTVVADPLPEHTSPGQSLALDVHVVNDTRQPVSDAVVTASLSWPGGERTWRWGGEIGPDDVARVATIPVVVPDTAGELVLRLTLVAAGTSTEVTYRTVVA